MSSACSDKACSIHPDDRIQIGGTYASVPPLRRFIGVCLIYAPIIFFPFAILIAVITRFSLTVLGARNLKSYWDFVPAMISHR